MITQYSSLAQSAASWWSVKVSRLLVPTHGLNSPSIRLLSLSITCKQHVCDLITCVKSSIKVGKTSLTLNIAAIPVVHATLCFDFLADIVAVLDRLRYVLFFSLGLSNISPTLFSWWGHSLPRCASVIRQFG